MAKHKKQAPAQYAPRRREIEYPKVARTAKVFSSTITPVQSGVFIRERETDYVPSRTTPGGSTPKKDTQVYSGDSMIGSSVINKSGLAPAFNHEHIKDIAAMRR